MNDKLTAYAQVWLATLYALGFLIVLGLLIFLPLQPDDTTKTLLLTMLGVLGTLATQQSSYFFARQRPGSDPEGKPEVKP